MGTIERGHAINISGSKSLTLRPDVVGIHGQELILEVTDPDHVTKLVGCNCSDIKGSTAHRAVQSKFSPGLICIEHYFGPNFLEGRSVVPDRGLSQNAARLINGSEAHKNILAPRRNLSKEIQIGYVVAVVECFTKKSSPKAPVGGKSRSYRKGLPRDFKLKEPETRRVTAVLSGWMLHAW